MLNSILMDAQRGGTHEIATMFELDDTLLDLVSGAGGPETAMMTKCGSCDSQLTMTIPGDSEPHIDCVC